MTGWRIYEILFPNGKRYIGKDAAYPSRKLVHLRQAKRDKPSQLCERKMAEYGVIHIAPIVTGLTEEEANLAEEFFIALFCTNVCKHGAAARGYNRTDGGEGVSGYVFFPETKGGLIGGAEGGAESAGCESPQASGGGGGECAAGG